MTLIRWNPARDAATWHPVSDLASEFLTMQREIDRMFDRWQGGVLNQSSSAAVAPVVDILERDDSYLVHMELPGVDKNDVKITVSNDVLTVKGEKKQAMDREGENYHRVERSYGTFQRSFSLPTSVKGDKIEASYDNGVVTIILPKVEEARPKEVEVKIR